MFAHRAATCSQEKNPRAVFRVELLAAGASNDQISKMRSNVSIHIGQDRRFFRAAWPRCAIPNQIRDRVSFLRRIY